jgi:hypothetical protein
MGYVAPTAGTGLVPLYRLYSAAATDQFYTTNASERDTAVRSLGYVEEGIVAYFAPAAP